MVNKAWILQKKLIRFIVRMNTIFLVFVIYTKRFSNCNCQRYSLWCHIIVSGFPWTTATAMLMMRWSRVFIIFSTAIAWCVSSISRFSTFILRSTAKHTKKIQINYDAIQLWYSNVKSQFWWKWKCSPNEIRKAFLRHLTINFNFCFELNSLTFRYKFYKSSKLIRNFACEIEVVVGRYRGEGPEIV